jgi:hypothetical protein
LFPAFATQSWSGQSRSDSWRRRRLDAEARAAAELGVEQSAGAESRATAATINVATRSVAARFGYSVSSMAGYVEAPQRYSREDPSLFLAGGISGCPDWQREMVSLLAPLEITVLNPRRARWTLLDDEAAVEQIEWEHRHLEQATALLFWFPAETLCPIALFELGSWSRSRKPLFVGTHERYARRLDIDVQLRLARPEITVVRSLDALAVQVWASFGEPQVTPR